MVSGNYTVLYESMEQRFYNVLDAVSFLFGIANVGRQWTQTLLFSN